MIRIFTNERDDLPSPGLMIWQNSSQEFLQMETITDETKESLLNNKRNTNVMRLLDTILDAAAEAVVDENWCLIDNQSMWNTFINGKYLPNIRNAPDGQYICVHYKAGVTYTNNIGDLPGHSNTVWYNSKGIANIMSLILVQKHHLVTYNSQYGNKLFIHNPQRPTFNMTKAGLFNHDTRHLLKNKNVHIMVNYSRSPITLVEGKNKQYTARDLKRSDRARWFQNIAIQKMKRIIHTVDNNTLQNLPIFEKMLGWLITSMDTVCNICKSKQSVTIFSMCNLSWYQMSPKAFLINTRNPPWAVTSCTSTTLTSWTSHPNTLYLPQE